MSLLQIRVFGDPVLRQEAREVDSFDERLRRLADDMLETMRDAPGVGLAAPQVGVLKRLFTFEFPGMDEDDPGEHGGVVNPVLVDASEDAEESDEGCLSFPGLFYPVERPLHVEIAWQDLDGAEHVRQLSAFEARVWLHEMDHLDGVLFIDHLAKHDRKEAMKLMRQYREEHDVDMPGQGKLANLLLGGGAGK
jgi:peptide deformylase